MVSNIHHGNKESDPCPLCNGSELKILFELKKEQFVCCKACDLIHINPKPDSEKILSTYSEEYSYIYRKKESKKLKRANRHVKRIKIRYKKSGRWLDVGCSSGFVIKACLAHGFEGHGLDIDANAVAYGRSEFGLENLKTGTLENTSYPTGYFDVISAYDVIEHVENLHSFTAELKRILKPNGLIDLVTPNAQHWSVPNNLRLWKEIKPSEHLYYFGKNNLADLLKIHGLYISETRFTLKSTLKVVVKNTKVEHFKNAVH